ncbi:MAG: GspH/FimT family pseudopilin [Arenicellales bacterium]
MGEHTPRRAQHGFTLLEIMVVLALIAISVTFVVLNLQRDTDGVAELEARRFAGLIEQARNESILSGRPYAVKVDTDRKTYTFLEHQKEWSAVKGDDVFRPRSFPQDLNVSLETTGSPGAGDLLVIEGLGEITPFVLTIRGKSRLYKVSIDEGQNVIVSSAPNET